MKKKKTLLGDVLQGVSRYFFILVGLVLVLLFASCIRTVESGNVAVVLRFGRLVGDTREEQVREPGLHFAFPYMIDEVVTVPTGSVIEQAVNTYYTEGKLLSNKEGGYLITGDNNVAVLSATVQYTITDPVAYALQVNEVDRLIDAAVSNAMLSQAVGMDVDDLLTVGKEQFAAHVLREAGAKLDELGVGVTLATLELTRVAMPEEVRDIYDLLTAARVNKTTIENQALLYSSRLDTDAKQKKAVAIASATVEYNSRVSAANLYMAEFWGLIEEYERSAADREVVEARVYAQKITEAIGRFAEIRVIEDENTKVFLDP